MRKSDEAVIGLPIFVARTAVSLFTGHGKRGEKRVESLLEKIGFFAEWTYSEPDQLPQPVRDILVTSRFSVYLSEKGVVIV